LAVEKVIAIIKGVPFFLARSVVHTFANAGSSLGGV